MNVFILGAPRSGTTFLASLLTKTRFASPFETQFIVKYYKKLSLYGDLVHRKNFNRLVKDILSERAVRQWKLEINLGEFYVALEGKRNYVNIIDALCTRRNNMIGFNFWGDKTPHYLADFEIIYNLFPDSYYLYIVRDGRDVALSLLLKEWGPNNIYACAEYWKRLNVEHPAFVELEKKGKLLFLRYEDLLDNTEEYVTKVYNFLGEKIDENKILKLSSTVQAGNYFKWRNNMSPKQIQIFDQVAGNTLKRFGYETNSASENLSPLVKMLYLIHDRFDHVIFLFKTNIIDGFKIRFLGKEPFTD
jgi:hypothetical protein